MGYELKVAQQTAEQWTLGGHGREKRLQRKQGSHGRILLDHHRHG